MAHKIELRVGPQTYVVAVEKAHKIHDDYIVFLEEDRFPYHVSRGGVVSYRGLFPKIKGARLLCHTAVELAKEFLEE